MATRMLQRRGTAAEWAAQNPVLGPGEIGFETDTKIIRVGDGVTAWNSLTVPYISVGGGTMTGALTLIAPTQPNHAARLTDISAGLANVSLREMLVLIANTSFVKANYSWMKFVKVRLVGGGGAGGGAPSTGSGESSAGSGGGSGAYAESLIAVNTLSASESVIIGNGGIGVNGAPGNAGGVSSFGAHASAGGGLGGNSFGPTGSNLPVFLSGGLGGTATVGIFKIKGTSGGFGVLGNATPIAGNMGGRGGDSLLGSGAIESIGVVGSTALGYGGGGSGGARRAGNNAVPGGDGFPGVVILELYG